MSEPNPKTVRVSKIDVAEWIGTVILIRAGDLAAFIEAKNTAGPMPIKQVERRRYARETARIVEEGLKRHGLKMPKEVPGSDENT
jgi:hypothetical protein